jgi:hypothetical protein
MSSFAAARCRHIKVSGTQCGSPALRKKNFCFYHQQNRPLTVECYSEQQYATGEIDLPVFEDAHSIQTVIRQVVQMVLQKRIERKTASLLLYALQIASSNLKRMELEKPQPEQVVTDLDLEMESETPMAAVNENTNIDRSDENLPPGTIQACYRPGAIDIDKDKDNGETRTGSGFQRRNPLITTCNEGRGAHSPAYDAAAICPVV